MMNTVGVTPSLPSFMLNLALEQYTAALQALGFDDVPTLAAIDEIELDQVSMLPGHRKKLKMALEKWSMGQPKSIRASIASAHNNNNNNNNTGYVSNNSFGASAPVSASLPLSSSTMSSSSFSGNSTEPARKAFGGASYMPRGSATAVFPAPVVLPQHMAAAGVNRSMQEVATENLARGGMGVMTRKEGAPRNSFGTPSYYGAGAGASASSGAGFGAAAGPSGPSSSLHQVQQQPQQQFQQPAQQRQPQPPTYQNPALQRQQSFGTRQPLQGIQAQPQQQQPQQVVQVQQRARAMPGVVASIPSEPEQFEEQNPVDQGDIPDTAAANGNAIDLGAQTPRQERLRGTRVQFAPTPDLVSVEPDRPLVTQPVNFNLTGKFSRSDFNSTAPVARTNSLQGPHIAVATPGSVDTKSNLTSSDNPLAHSWNRGQSQQMQAAGRAAHSIAAPGTVDSKSNFTSSDNPLANTWGRTAPASTPRGSGVASGLGRSGIAVAQPGTVDTKSNFTSSDNPLANNWGRMSRPGPAATAATPRGIAVAAPGTVDTKSNYTSSDNPLAQSWVGGRAQPQQRTTEYVKFAAEPGSASAQSNVASADNPLVPTIRLGPVQQQRAPVYQNKSKPVQWARAQQQVSSQQASQQDEVEYVKFAAMPGTVGSASNVASVDNPLVPTIAIHHHTQPTQPARLVKLIPRG